MKRARSVLLLALCMLLGLVAGSSAFASTARRMSVEAVQKAIADPGNLLLLDVIVQRTTVASSMTAFQVGDAVYVPLGELARVLTFLVQADPAAGKARGFLLREERSFDLDVGKAQVIISGSSQSFDPAQVLVQSDDIYVEISLLEQWWPLKFKMDLAVLQLKVIPAEPLPLQLRLSREQAARSLGRMLAPTRELPREPLPYAAFSIPAIDQTISVFGSQAGGMNSWAASSTTFLTGDLLGLETSAYAYLGSSSGPSTESKFRITLGRSDQNGDVLRFIPATTASAGNILLPGVEHVSRSSVSGNGLFFSNVPLYRPSTFGVTSFQGNLQPGWDVELFFNDALVGYQQSRPDGTYSFPDQTLVFGENRYRLVFHGPQGQIRVESKTLMLDSSTVRPNELLYSVGLQRDDQGFDRQMVQLEYGLNSQIALQGGLVAADLGLDRKPRHYLNAGVRSFSNGWLLSGNGIWCGECRRGLLSVALSKRLSYGSMQVSQAVLPNFVSDLYSDGTRLVDASTRARVDLAIPLAPKRSLPLTFQMRADRLRSGEFDYTTSARATQSILRTLLTQELTSQNTDGTRVLSGNLQLSRSIAGTSTRAQLSHTLHPNVRAKVGVLATDASLPGRIRLNATVTRVFDTRDTTLALNLNRSFGTFSLRTGFTRNTAGAFSGALQLFTSMARDSRAEQWRFSVLPLGGNGAASVRAFLDKNLNGVFDEGDEPIPGATFRINGSTAPPKTDAGGFAYLERLNSHRSVSVELNPASLEDSQWSPARPGVTLIPRPGRIATIDFPVIVTAELDGYVSLERNGQQRGVSDVLLNLYDEKGTVVASARSTGDGYYIFSGVRPGRYRIGVAPELIQRLRLEPVDDELVTVSADGNPTDGIDFVLRARDSAAAP